jgi:hypothetical protein
MSANEPTKNEAQTEPEEDETGRPVEQLPTGVHEVPLFLRDSSDVRQGNAQDEKDETGE